jgi:hypothetical protein
LDSLLDKGELSRNKSKENFIPQCCQNKFFKKKEKKKKQRKLAVKIPIVLPDMGSLLPSPWLLHT